jgi:hypothetical protein
MLFKVNIIDSKIYDYWHPFIREYILNNAYYTGYITLDYKNMIRIKKDVLIPFQYNKHIIFKYIDTFQQNDSLLAKNIRHYIINYIGCNYNKNNYNNYNNYNEITCIGGDSYVYLKMIPHIINSNYYSNQDKLKFEADFNLDKKTNYTINYNKVEELDTYSTVIINLSKLNSNLMTILNKNINININKKINKKIETIIIINCDHIDFWKKIKLLDTFKIIKRKQFISHDYFVTVTLLKLQ